MDRILNVIYRLGILRDQIQNGEMDLKEPRVDRQPSRGSFGMEDEKVQTDWRHKKEHDEVNWVVGEENMGQEDSNQNKLGEEYFDQDGLNELQDFTDVAWNDDQSYSGKKENGKKKITWEEIRKRHEK